MYAGYAAGGSFFQALNQIFNKGIARRADIELFYFEEKTKGNLLPAEFPRILQQMKEVSHFVDKILCYQYQGQMNKPGTGVYAGHSSRNSVRLYEAYSGWLSKQPRFGE